MRLPFSVTEVLSLNFHNFNPRASSWVDRIYKETFFKLFPESFLTKSQRLQDILLRIFRVRVLPKKTLLLEEGSVAKEVVIILKGDVNIYRRLPNSVKPAKIEDQKIPQDRAGLESPKNEGQEKNSMMAELS